MAKKINWHGVFHRTGSEPLLWAVFRFKEDADQYAEEQNSQLNRPLYSIGKIERSKLLNGLMHYKRIRN